MAAVSAIGEAVTSGFSGAVARAKRLIAVKVFSLIEEIWEMM